MTYSVAQRKRYARKLRRNQTAAEKRLWPLYLLGFKPQRITKCNYVADWGNELSKVIIELDGGPHFTREGKRKDQARDRHHKSKDYITLRFKNETVIKHRGGVITLIFIRSVLHQMYLWFRV